MPTATPPFVTPLSDAPLEERVRRQQLHAQYLDHTSWLGRAYAEILERTGWNAVVLHSGSLVLRSQFDDQYWPLRVVPHFAHWLPLEWPDCALVVAPHLARPRLLVFRDLSFWERAAEPDWAHFLAAFDSAEVTSLDEVKTEIAQALAKAAGQRGRVAFIGEDRRRATAWGFDESAVNPAPLLAELDRLRTRKTSYEIACLSEANRRAATGHGVAASSFLAGNAIELDLHLRFLLATEQDDAQTPYKNIVAIGSNAAILHHVHYRRAVPQRARSFLLDAGATCYGYAADVTRTHLAKDASGSEAANLFEALLSRMEAMQQSLCAQVRIGEPYEALHDRSHLLLAGVLLETGLCRPGQASAEAIVEAGVTRKLYPHGLGHSLGLQTHDVGCLVEPPRKDNPWLRNTSRIAPGQVFTIEPGIYFIDTLLESLRASPAHTLIDWPAVEAVAPFGGIRIEDDLLVLDPSEAAAGGTTGGEGGSPTVRNLTREAFAG